jgi:hypothetical protein
LPFYRSPASSVIFAIIHIGEYANAAKSGAQHAIHERGVAAQSLQITNIAESGMQIAKMSTPIM